jgi:hypothetical protein
MQLIERNKQKATALSAGLREGRSESLLRRRGAFGLFLAASASMSVVALYPMGVLKLVLEPRFARLGSDHVTGSAKAYSLRKAGCGFCNQQLCGNDDSSGGGIAGPSEPTTVTFDCGGDESGIRCCPSREIHC